MASNILVELAIREYETLRMEVVNTVERQYSLTSWGVSTAAVFVAAVVGGWGHLQSVPIMISVIVLLIFPAAMTVYVVSWSHVITKINQLGARLFEIEENMSRIVDPDLVKETYQLASLDEVIPYKYTFGWEHKLWKNGSNYRVQTTIKTVRAALAIMYTLVIVGNALLIANIRPDALAIAGLVSLIAGICWAIVWNLIFQYLSNRLTE